MDEEPNALSVILDSWKKVADRELNWNNEERSWTERTFDFFGHHDYVTQGKPLLTDTRKELEQVGANVANFLMEESKEKENTWNPLTYTDDALRLAGGGAKNVAWAIDSLDKMGQDHSNTGMNASLLQGIGYIAGNAIRAVNYSSEKSADIIGWVAKETGWVDEKAARFMGSFIPELALGGLGKTGQIKKGFTAFTKVDDLTRAQQLSRVAAGATPEVAYGMTIAPGLQPFQSKIRTAAQRSTKSGIQVANLRKTPEGIKRIEAALKYKSKRGNLIGFGETQKPWILPNGDEVFLKSSKSGVRLKLKSDAASSRIMRGTKERFQTYGNADWDRVLDGFVDPKRVATKIEGHHKHMIDGYQWAFDGATPREANIITKHFFDKKTPLGKTQFNRNNLPQAVHKALHKWMDKQMGLNGLDMPSLKGMSPKKRIQYLEVYMENIQPAMDEATFILMERWNAGKPLFSKEFSMADQFTDAARRLQ